MVDESMRVRARCLALTACVTACASTVGAQGSPAVPAVVLSRIPAYYPGIAEAARIQGKVTVRVAVRPDGTVYETTLVEGARYCSQAAVDFASQARFECRGCTEPS